MTEKELDEKIDQMVQKEEIPYPDDYDEYIQKIIDDLPDEPHMEKSGHKSKRISYFRPTWRMVVAAALVIVVLSSIPAGAALRGYLRKMKTMDREKRQEYILDLENSFADKDYYSRELTEEEKNRGKALLPKYESGESYPEKELRTVQNESQIQPDQLCFMQGISTFYLPDRKLTDEELLEIIDFHYKRNYSLEERQKEDEEAADSEQLESLQEVTKEEAVRLSQKWVRKICDTDVTEWKYNVEFHGGIEKGAKYITAFHDPVGDDVYSVGIDASSGACCVLEMFRQKEPDYGTSVAVDRQKLTDCCRQVWQIAKKLEPEWTNTKTSCYYTGKRKGESEKGVVNYLVEAEGGQGYLLCYSFHSDRVFWIERLSSVSNWKREEKKAADEKELNRYQISLH